MHANQGAYGLKLHYENLQVSLSVKSLLRFALCLSSGSQLVSRQLELVALKREFLALEEDGYDDATQRKPGEKRVDAAEHIPHLASIDVVTRDPLRQEEPTDQPRNYQRKK